MIHVYYPKTVLKCMHTKNHINQLGGKSSRDPIELKYLLAKCMPNSNRNMRDASKSGLYLIIN